VRALDLDTLASDRSLDTNSGRLAARERIVRVISERVAERPASTWRAMLDAAGVPSGEVRTVLEALRGVDASATTGVAPSVPGTVRRRPPRLDEHGPLVRARGWGAFDHH
jgi:crotonobetainyl-CoA:carnitine CoA-transferase CaiB-like acyl-CoA transferase